MNELCITRFDNKTLLFSYLDSIAIFVLDRLWYKIVAGMAGASFSMTLRVASGVTSRGANPVPPVVKTASNFLTSAHSFKVP